MSGEASDERGPGGASYKERAVSLDPDYLQNDVLAGELGSNQARSADPATTRPQQHPPDLRIFRLQGVLLHRDRQPNRRQPPERDRGKTAFS